MKISKFYSFIAAVLFLTTTVSATDIPEEMPIPTPPEIILETSPHRPDWWNEEHAPQEFLGNAELVDSQQIVFESNLITFISVNTNAGNVFYILIDHRIPVDDEEGVSNVYFLTKVNEFDLLSLLYSPDPNAEETPEPPVHPAVASGIYSAPATSEESSGEASKEASEEESQEATPPVSPGFLGIPPFILIIIAVIVLGLAALGVYMYLNGKKTKPKKSTLDDDDDDLDEDITWQEDGNFDDEIEV